MAHNPIPTASCTFAANLVNDVKVVYSGPLSYAFTGNAWSPIGLQCDFDYNGVDQLVMEIRYRGAAAGASFYRTATDPRRTYALGVGTFGATTAMSCNGAAGTKMLLTFTEVKDGGGSTPVPGGVKNLVFNAPRDPGLTYYAGASLGSVPGVPIPPCRVLPLNVDVLLVLSLTVPAVFSSFSGILDPSGNATAAIYLPGAPLSGTIVYLSFVTLTQVGAVKSIAGSASFQIQ
jgi:hypothetical protein